MANQFNIFKTPFIVFNFDPTLMEDLGRTPFSLIHKLINPSIHTAVEPMETAVFIVQGHITNKRKSLIENYLRLVESPHVIAVGAECMSQGGSSSEIVSLDSIVDVDFFIPRTLRGDENISPPLIAVLGEIETQVRSEEK